MDKLKNTLTSWKTLAEHAFGQSQNNFFAAVTLIDKEFGEGYAKAHPELVGDFLKAAATETAGTIIYMGLQHIDETFTELTTELTSHNYIADELEKIKHEIRDLNFADNTNE